MSDVISSEIIEKVAGPRVEWWRPPCQFAIRSVVGVFIFGTVAMTALSLDSAVKFLQQHHIGSVIVYGLTAIEYLLFVIDSALFATFIIREAVKAFWELT